MFKTFPEFSKLTLADRGTYEPLVSSYPPLSDIDFANLMTWWEPMGGLAVSLLHDNLVLSYWIPGDDDHSGLSLVGTNHVDESVCEIFDYLRSRGEQPRLVNVPEFVANNMRFPELFTFKTNRDDDEYLLGTSRFAALDGMPYYMRLRVRRFLREAGKANIEVKELDIKSARVRRLLLACADSWPKRGINSINRQECEALPASLALGPILGLKGIGLWIRGELQGYLLYFPTHDSDYLISSHARVNYDMPRIFDYMVYAFSEYLESADFKYMNIHADNGSQKMRVLKIALKPENFFRKYCIEPA